MPALARAGFRAVAPDLRGYASSPKPRGVDQYRVPLLVDDVAQLIESLGPHPASGHPLPLEREREGCVLVGHDWGAAVAWFVAMLRPDLVRKLVILGVPHPAIFVRELKRSREQKQRAMYQLFFQLPVLPELFMRIFGKTMMRRAGRFTEDDIREYARAWRGSLTTMLHYYRALRLTRGALRPLMKPIAMPVLLLWGEREQVFVREAWTNYGDWVKDLRVEMIRGAGHFVQTDAAEVINEKLIEFAK